AARGAYGVATGAGSLALSTFFSVEGSPADFDLDLDGDGSNDANSHTAIASGDSSVAVGTSVWAKGRYNTAVGVGNTTFGEYANAVGADNQASCEGYCNALGSGKRAMDVCASAFGYRSQALASRSTALGYQSVASEAGTVSFGHSATDLDVFGNAYGSDLDARLVHVAAGIDGTDAVNVDQLNSAIAGVVSGATASPFFVADGIGDGSDSAVVTGDNSVAVGANSVASRDDVVSVGDDGAERQVVNVADGSEDTDAVNLRQLDAMGNLMANNLAGFLGGGAAWNGSVFTAPTYVIQGAGYNDVGTAFAAVDSQ